ncbi:ATP-binding protein [Rhodovulum sp. P5]|uniref:ATP-binding protein n=1 Tax=Rhodovulum sp. P5 TaxID=1564506 RepID=UPI0009D97417|nr:ATP-binding protein [Rhodovulum sp. P5]
MTAVAACLAFVLGVMAFLALDVRRQVDELATANSDNVQWTLSIIQVELTELESAALMAQAGTGSLDEVRRRFDVFYNRADIVTNGAVYAALVAAGDLEDEIVRIWREIDATVPLIDAPDPVLAAGVGDLAIRMHDLHAPLRAVALEGVKALAEGADRHRADVVALLTRLALITAALVVLLLGTLWVLVRLNGKMFVRTRELQMTSSRLAATVNTAIDAVIVADGAMRILDFNPAAEEIFGYRREDVLGRAVYDIMVPGDFRSKMTEALERFHETGRLHLFDKERVEAEARRRNGETFPVEVSVNTADSENGKIFVGFVRDISDRKAAEAELTRARDDALAGEKAKANLLAVMSHEMRTPLNGMLGALELLQDTPLDADQRDHLAIMESSGRMLLHHVNDVLDISRLDSGQVEARAEVFDLGALLSEMVTMHRPQAAAAGNRLVLEDETAGGTVVGDDRRLRQILVNLIGNALKFTRGGTVTLCATRPGPGDLVELSVRDTGVGMAAAELPRIFDEFYTVDATYGRETEGTGLGLSITARLVNLLGGEIAVESTPGMGSTFRVRLPMPPVSVPDLAGAVPEGDTAAATPALNILLVEDNRVNRRLARAMLEKLGHVVTEAVDGAEGVEKAFGTPYDVILTDISMPRLDGVEAVRRIRAGGASRHARIIALTAHAMPDEIARFRAAGMDDVGTKPVSRKQLGTMLAPVCRPCAGLGDDPAADLRQRHG